MTLRAPFTLPKLAALSFALAMFFGLTSPIVLSAPEERPRQRDDSMVQTPEKTRESDAVESARRQAEEEREARAGRDEKRGEPDQDDPRARWEWQRAESGIPSLDLQANVLRARRERAQRARAGVDQPGAPLSPTPSDPVWVPIGPTGADYEQNGGFTYYERDSGRARKILPHPTDPDTLYFLSSGGGLWRTHNFTANPPTWTPLQDALGTTSGGTAVFGRTPNVIYLGTGDPFDIVNIGGSIAKSVDGGDTWSPEIDLPNTVSVRDIAIDTTGPQDIVMVATDNGFYRSTDDGATYTLTASGVGQAFQNKSVWNIVQTSAGWLASAQPCPAANLGIQCGQAGVIYVSTDQGATWNPVPNTGTVYTGSGRTSLAVAAPGESIVYAFAELTNTSGQKDLFKSTDGGLNWTALNITPKVPTNPNPDNGNMNLLHVQGYYNQLILVDPRDGTRNTVYLGGDLSTAVTTNGGTTWTLLSNWITRGATGSPGEMPYVHADCHAAAFTNAGGTDRLLFGSDGGLFESLDNGATWSSEKNNGLQTFLFYSIASTPAFPNAVMGGAQDNGTRVRHGETKTYNQTIGGDGLGSGWSQTDGYVAMGSVQNNSNRRNFNGVPELGGTWETARPQGIPTADQLFSTPVETPTAAADPTGKVFFTNSARTVYKTTNGAVTWTIIGRTVGTPNNIPLTGTLRGTAHGLGVSPSDINRIAVIATGGQVVISLDGGTTWTVKALNTLVPGFNSNTAGVTWGNNTTIYVTSVAPLTPAVRIAKSTDSGATWARADSGIPDVPVHRVVVDTRDATGNTLLAATHVGVYRSTDGGANWTEYGVGLPNVVVRDLYMPPNGSYVLAGTYGRGFYELPGVAFSSASLSDDVESCDSDGSLDNGDTGNLTVTLRNDSGTSLGGLTATVTSTNPNIYFPSGNSVSFPPAAAGATTTAAVAVKMYGATGIQSIDFDIAFDDPALGLTAPATVRRSFRGNIDEVASANGNDSQATISAWTPGGAEAPVLPDITAWERREISPFDRQWLEMDANLISDQWLTSPVMSVGPAPFTLTFDHFYVYEFGTSGPTTFYFDGMVIEYSDAGGPWTDITTLPGATLTPAYDHVIATGGGNPIEGRSAYSGRSLGYPAFVPVTANMGTSLAGHNVQLRLRMGTDVSGYAVGAHVRNLIVNGITNTPFTTVTADSGHCPADTTAPDTMITSGPSGVTTTPVTYQWTGTDDVAPVGALTYAYRLQPVDSGFSAFGSATSKTYPNLASGDYTFCVKARDGSGNEDPTPDCRSFTIQTAVEFVSMASSVAEGGSASIGVRVTTADATPIAGDVTVQFSTANGTATGADYTPTSTTVTFPSGTASGTVMNVAVPTTQDLLDEADETFTANLSSPTGSSLGATTVHTVTITDDDAAPSVSIGDVSIAEGNSGTSMAGLTVSLSAASGQTVTVNYATANDTATAGSDYTAGSGTVTFMPGVTTQTVNVVITGDLLNEPNETLFVNLSSPTNATIGDGQGVVTITNDDPAPSISINDVAVTEGNSGTTAATLTVSLSAASGQTVTVDYATANDTALAGSDYVAASGTLTFAPGVISQTITVTVNGDVLDEPNETAFVNLSNPTNATISDGQGLLTINDDDATPTLSISDVAVAEGNAGTSTATVNVTLSAASGQTVTVDYATADGTATQPGDYASTSGTLTFTPGTTTLPISVTVNGDTVPEPDETVFVNLSAPTNATISDGQGVVSILNDEGPTTQNVVWTSLVGVSATGNSLTKTAGTTAWDAGAVSTQSFSGDGYVEITASQTNTYRMFGLSNGNTNASDSDIDFALYLYGDGTLRIKEGGTSRFSSGTNPTFGTYMTGDLLRVAVEGGVVKYRKNGTLLFTSTVAPTFPLLVDTSLNTPASTITNAVISFDGRPRISISDASVTEGNTGTTTANFTVTLSAAAAGPVTVNYATSNNTATSPGDYASATGTVTFNPGETSKPVAVTVNGDSTEEPNETFFVDLSAPSVNAVINDGHGIGTIVNDDGPVVANVVWTSLVGASATGNTLTKTAGTTAWDAGAVSTQNISSGIGYVEVTASETSTYRIFGLSNGNTNAAETDIDFGMYLFLNEIHIKEGGTNRLNGSNTSFGTFVTGDLLRVAVNNGVVRYSKNGTVFYTSTVTATYPLLVDTSLFSPGATISNAVISFDPRPILSINDATVTEGNTGTTTASFTVTLSAASPTTVTVDYATADDTATTGDNDYAAATGTLTFLPGETTKPVSVTVNGDTNEEANETFFVNLSNASSSAVIGDAQGLGTINNDDGPITSNVVWTSLVGASATGNTLTKTATTMAWDAGAVSTQSIAGGDGGVDFVVNETTSYRVVGLSNGNSNASDADVDFGLYLFLNQLRVKEGGVNRMNGPSLSFGTVVAGDHVQVGVDNGVVKYAKNGVVFYTSTVAPVFPLLIDTSLFTPGATVTNAKIVTDPRPLLTINDVSVTEGNAGTTPATFTVTLSAAADTTVTVDYATANGTAVAPGDYASAAGTLTFNVGETTKTVTVDVAGDLLQESTETFTVNLSNVTGSALIGDAQGVGSILDNDSPPVENVVWTSLVGASAAGNNLTKTAGTSAWDAGAVSTRALGPGDGYVDLTASETTTYRMFGLSNGNGNASDADIDFALYLYGDGTIRIKEGGVSRFLTGSNPTFGTYVTGDHLRVSVEGGVVKYRKNGTLLYTSTVVPTSPLLVDTSLWSPGATLNGVVISGNLQ